MQIRLKRRIAPHTEQQQFDVMVDDGAEDWRVAGLVTLDPQSSVGFAPPAARSERWLWAASALATFSDWAAWGSSVGVSIPGGCEDTKEAAARACASAYWAAKRV